MSRHDILTKNSREYRAVKEFYGDRKAVRSKVPLIQHINDGLVVLEEIGASLHARKAFCLHPMFQADADLENTALTSGPFWSLEAHVILLVMEYRNKANAWLSEKVGIQSSKAGEFPYQYSTTLGKPSWGPLTEVRDMLIADKVQNYKDFLLHHQATHPRSRELKIYFKEWFTALDIDGAQFSSLCQKIDEARA